MDLGHGHLLALLAAERGAFAVVDVEESGKAFGMATSSIAAMSGGEAGGKAVAVLVDEMEQAAHGEEFDEEEEGGEEGGAAGALAGKKATLLMAEPWYLESSGGAGSGGGGTQADNLRFWRVVDGMRGSGLCAEGCKVLPQRARLVGVAVEFEDLRSPQKPVNEVMGLDLSAFGSIQPGGGAGGKPLPPTSYELWMYG